MAEDQNQKKQNPSESKNSSSSSNPNHHPNLLHFLNYLNGESEVDPVELGARASTSVKSYQNVGGIPTTNSPPGTNNGTGINLQPTGVQEQEVINTLNGFTNMVLAHEISVNDEYRLEKPKDDSLTGKVREQVHKAFWDIFREDLNKESPDYMDALGLLTSMKENLLDLLFPHNSHLKTRIHEVLDLDLIKQQIDNRVFGPQDCEKYTDFVIHLLSQMCCPIRDSDIAALRNLTDTAEVFRGIMETMDLMKLDMANFHIQQFRPLIIQNCVKYEKEKFANCMEMEYRFRHDSLKETRKWLLKYKADDLEPRAAIAKAFRALLDYETSLEASPETLQLDEARFVELSTQVKRVTYIGASILGVVSTYQMLFGTTVNESLRETIRTQLKLIVTLDDVVEKKKLEETMERVCEQTIRLVNESLGSTLSRSITDSEKSQFRTNILDILQPANRIRSLLLRRILEYAEELCLAEKSHPVNMPPGLTDIRSEVLATASRFQRLVHHNIEVFGEIYHGILNGKILAPKYPEELDGEYDSSFAEVMKLLQIPRTESHDDAQILGTSPGSSGYASSSSN